MKKEENESKGILLNKLNSKQATNSEMEVCVNCGVITDVPRACLLNYVRTMSKVLANYVISAEVFSKEICDSLRTKEEQKIY